MEVSAQTPRDDRSERAQGAGCLIILAAVALIVLLPLLWKLVSMLLLGVAALIGITWLTAWLFPALLAKVLLFALIVWVCLKMGRILFRSVRY